MKAENATGQPMFANSVKVLQCFFSLLFSNVSVQRVFSQLKIIKNDIKAGKPFCIAISKDGKDAIWHHKICSTARAIKRHVEVAQKDDMKCSK